MSARYRFINTLFLAVLLRKQLQIAIKQAKRHGVAIAHPRPLTIKTLTDLIPDLKRQIELISISEVLKR